MTDKSDDTVPLTLDDAWKAAEAALPPYGRIRSLVELAREWEAVAIIDNSRIRVGHGPTPAAALLALAERLRGSST